MSGTISIEHHAEHRWLWIFLRVLLALLIILLISYFAESYAKQLPAGQQKPARHRQLTKAEVLEAEQRLSDLGYWTGPIDGILDGSTRQALVAFQKIEGRKRTGALSAAELEALRAATPPEPRDKTYAHVEVDLARQVLMVINSEGNVTNVLAVCTGNEKFYIDQGKRQRAHTPRGNFTVARKINGLRISTLGALYYPCYIVGGIAIHGSPSVAPYPASHGCIRIPMFAAKAFQQMTPIGTVVVVYDAS